MVYLEFVPVDGYYNEIQNGKILLNNFSSATSAADIDKNLLTTYTDGTFNNIPQCNCGKHKVGYLEGKECPDCGSVIESIIKKKHPLVWFKRYPETERFISPYFWVCLRNILSTKIDVLRYLSDTKYNPPVDMPDWVRQLVIRLEYKRGYSNMIDNMELIIEFAIKHSKFKERNKYQELEIFLEIWRTQKHVILNDYMGLFNKRLFVMEETKMGNYTNLILGEVKSVAYNYLLNNSELTPIEKKENTMSRLVHGMANIVNNYLVENLQGKFGDFRKHFTGARMPFSFRTVIRSFKDEHRDNIHIPWAAGITTLRPHLLNLLVNRHKMSYKKASAYLYEHVKKYSELLDECFQTLINESIFGGIVVLYTRNPSLPMGSTQYKAITRVKKDVYDNTTSLSNLTVRPFNADEAVQRHSLIAA